MRTYKSGELAKLTSVNVETLRYYEREALLPAPERTDSGYRLYTADDVKRVQFIKRAQELGFTLNDIKELLALQNVSTATASKVQKLTEEKIQVIEQKIQTLQGMKKALKELLRTCPGDAGSIKDCPIIHCLESSDK